MKNQCPVCGFGRSYHLADGRLQCRKCKKKFSKKKSVWDHYRIAEKEKKGLLRHFVLGTPVHRLRFAITCSRPTAQQFFRDIRKVLFLHEQEQKPLSGALEIDESPFGGRRKGKRGWGAAGKILVFGIYKRNGQVRLSIIPNRKHSTIHREIQKHTTPGSLYFTDDYHAYTSLRLRGEHIVVTKEKGRPKGRHHINGIEGFWSYAKNWLYQYRGVPKKFFPFFLAELFFRFNHRKEDITPLVYKLLRETLYEKI